MKSDLDGVPHAGARDVAEDHGMTSRPIKGSRTNANRARVRANEHEDMIRDDRDACESVLVREARERLRERRRIEDEEERRQQAIEPGDTPESEPASMTDEDHERSVRAIREAAARQEERKQDEAA